MIQAMIFDLDGTLVQTEHLKAMSYARAAVALCPYSLTEAEVIEAFKDVVGLSRREVAIKLIERFQLEELAAKHMDSFGVSTPWQAYVQLRLQYYEELLADPDVLRNNQWPHNVELLNMARASSCKTALATMSHYEQVNHVLDVLNWADKFDFIATRDDVEHGKPNPEIYQLVSHELNIPPENCLVIEDSTPGVRAAIAAGMQVIAVSTPFTHDSLHEAQILEHILIVDDPVQLIATVQQFL